MGLALLAAACATGEDAELPSRSGGGGGVAGAAGVAGGTVLGGSGGLPVGGGGSAAAAGVGAFGGSAGLAGSGGGDGLSGGSGSGASGGSSGGSAGAGGGGAKACPTGSFVSGVDSSGTIQCVDPTSKINSGVNSDCSLYFGFRDKCDGCTTVPDKWGRVSQASCVNGFGSHNACRVHNLSGQSVQTFGLNTDGDVDGNDKFHLGIRCASPASSVKAGPCKADELAVGVKNGAVQCRSVRQAVTDYVSASCDWFFGWRDKCDGCATPPAKWGRARHGSCANGLGLHNTCSSTSLGGTAVSLFGLNTDNDVNGDDKFYLGMSCAAGSPGSSTSASICPSGQFVTGVLANGDVQCAKLSSSVATVVRSRCHTYFGWRDKCDACATTPPEKWGRVSHNGCLNGFGLHNTCSTASLLGKSVKLFGLNPDGDVDGNDTFYLGMKCF